jgi:hypothetical protein
MYYILQKNKKKEPDYNEVTNKIWKDCWVVISFLLAHNCNHSLQTGTILMYQRKTTLQHRWKILHDKIYSIILTTFSDVHVEVMYKKLSPFTVYNTHMAQETWD